MKSFVATARLARLALLGQMLAWSGLTLTLGWVVAALALPSVREDWLRGLGVSLGENGLFGTIVASLPAVLFAYCLWQAARLFGALRGAAPFSQRAVSALLGLGWGATATAVAGIVCRTGLYYLASFGSEDGKRALVLSLSSTDIGTLLVGILALTFALVVAEAHRLEDDARSIV